VRNPDVILQKFGLHVRTEFEKFCQICLDKIRLWARFQNFVQTSHQGYRKHNTPQFGNLSTPSRNPRAPSTLSTCPIHSHFLCISTTTAPFGLTQDSNRSSGSKDLGKNHRYIYVFKLHLDNYCSNRLDPRVKLMRLDVEVLGKIVAHLAQRQATSPITCNAEVIRTHWITLSWEKWSRVFIQVVLSWYSRFGACSIHVWAHPLCARIAHILIFANVCLREILERIPFEVRKGEIPTNECLSATARYPPHHKTPLLFKGWCASSLLRETIFELVIKGTRSCIGEEVELRDWCCFV
jgi:hypothetical protein